MVTKNKKCGNNLAYEMFLLVRMLGKQREILWTAKESMSVG